MVKGFYLFLILLWLFAAFFFPKNAFAIEDPTSFVNNTFGIHILFPTELEMAAKLVNSNGGDWGYVTIPIQSTDRNLEKWQKFMDDCRHFHIIPIVRIATYPQGNFWTTPTIFDHLDFANFLNSLSWPTKNRYIIVYNEPNSSFEWGGQVDAAHYAQELSHTIDAFKRVNEDFFIISAGLDSYAPNRGNLYENSYTFLLDMGKAVPAIFLRIDGFASHSYPSGDFSENPQYENRGGVFTYREETNFLKRQFARENIPIFITETGWKQERLSQEQLSAFYAYAFKNIWQEQNIIAITPFLLNGQGSAFSGFSLLKTDGHPTKIFEAIASISKEEGKPTILAKEERHLDYQVLGAKDFRDVGIALPTIQINPSLKAFLKWFFYR